MQTAQQRQKADVVADDLSSGAGGRDGERAGGVDEVVRTQSHGGEHLPQTVGHLGSVATDAQRHGSAVYLRHLSGAGGSARGDGNDSRASGGVRRRCGLHPLFPGVDESVPRQGRASVAGGQERENGCHLRCIRLLAGAGVGGTRNRGGGGHAQVCRR